LFCASGSENMLRGSRFIISKVASSTIGCLLGALMGMVNGLLITKGRMAPFIETHVTMTMFRVLTLVYKDGNPITGIGDSNAFPIYGARPSAKRSSNVPRV
jgi:ribose/xylose/arabinose/galactoside ABC-type transport system permease subunit